MAVCMEGQCGVTGQIRFVSEKAIYSVVVTVTNWFQVLLVKIKSTSHFYTQVKLFKPVLQAKTNLKRFE